MTGKAKISQSLPLLFAPANPNPNMASLPSKEKKNMASHFPSHLLAIILCRLSAADFIRCAAVCRSWRRATADNPHSPSSSEIPYLIIPGRHKSAGKLFNLANNKLSRFPIIGGQRYIGSYDGWVVTVDGLSNLRAFNPFTGAKIELPSLTTLSGMKGVRRNADTRPDVSPGIRFCNKAIYSPSEKTAVALHSDCSDLAFARVGDDSWTELDPIYHDYFEDFVLHNGQLFAVNQLGCITVFNLGSGPSSPPFTVTLDEWCPPILDFCKHYVVKSLDGDLLLVFWKTTTVFNWDYPYEEVRTQFFKIFKLESNGPRVEVTSLGVKAALFLGYYHSVSISTRDSPLKENCIYFIDKDDVGVFNLEDGRMVHSYKLRIGQFDSTPPIWIVPTLS